MKEKIKYDTTLFSVILHYLAEAELLPKSRSQNKNSIKKEVL